ncbi:MAG: hypothetical protein U5N10_05390 [Gemmobacter sp.]|nr:hypothetical protein [Gemmobacter sp.]
MDLPEVFFDEVKIVQQPFCGRGHGLPGLQPLCAGAIGLQKDIGIFFDTTAEGANGTRFARCNRLCGRQRQSMMFKPFGAEKICTDGRCIQPDIGRSDLFKPGKAREAAGQLARKAHSIDSFAGVSEAEYVLRSALPLAVGSSVMICSAIKVVLSALPVAQSARTRRVITAHLFSIWSQSIVKIPSGHGSTRIRH